MHRSLAHIQLRPSSATVLLLALGLCASSALAQGPRPLPSTEARLLVLDRHEHGRLPPALAPPSGDGFQFNNWDIVVNSCWWPRLPIPPAPC